jgi:MFS family permease
VNLISLSHGCAIGFVSPFLPYLRSDESHLATGPVSSENVSWIGSLLAVGGFFGAIIYGKISQKFGQKFTLIALVVPHLCFWCLVLASSEVHHLYIARILAGLTGGGTIRTIPLYISEISENNIRGKLGTYLMLFLSTGTLIIFVAGTYLSFLTVPLFMLMFPVFYLILVSFLPDTPPSLMSRNLSDEAWDSLLFYRTCDKNTVVSESFKQEFDLLKLTLENKSCEKLEMKDFCEFI